jgi:hypothetical protein
MSASTRAARVRRALAISSAAVVVAVVAAACGTASASPAPTVGQSATAQAADGHTHSHEVVPLASAEDGPADGEQADDAAPTDAAPDEAAPADAPADAAVPAADGAEQQAAEDAGAAEKDGEAEKKDEGEQENVEEKKDNEKKDAAPPKLDILGTDCKNSDLELHDGFQKAPRCVETSFGEVPSADKSPSLLITDAPDAVQVQEGFQIVVSTRNLKRDRFLGAAVGGYYAESSFLDSEGIQRGHFHTACRFLPSLDEAPDAAPVPAFFLATQDNQGGAGEDKVTIDVPGLGQAGTVQCAVWAGDGSHRVPMMERANQTPAFDAVRITVE